MKDIPYKIYLTEEEMPRYWYNVRADMKTKPAPLLNPATLRPMTQAELEQVFCRELAAQELDDRTPYIEIPREVRNFYRMYRPSPWFGPIVWRKSSGLRQRSTTSSRAATPPAPTSSIPPSPRLITPKSRVCAASPRRREPASGARP